MAAATPFIRSIISALVGPGATPHNFCEIGNGTDSNGPIPSPLFTNIPTFIASLLSISALRDWLKLFVIGAVLEFCRRLGVKAYNTIYNWFFITAVFMEDDDCFGEPFSLGSTASYTEGSFL
jgi:chaperone BCS1